MKTDHFTRRHLLALSAASITSLAGCSDVTDRNNQETWTPAGGGYNETTTTASRPDTPAATFKGANTTYTLYDLPEYTGRRPIDFEWLGYEHPDNRIIHVEATDSTINVTVDAMTLNREVEAAVHYPVQSGQRATKTKTLTANSQSTAQKHEWSFDVSDTTLPRLTAGSIEITLTDSRVNNVERSLTNHRFMVFPYENATGSHVHYVNADAIQFKLYTNKQGKRQLQRPAKTYSEAVETDADRTRFYVSYRRNYPLFGATTTVPKEPYTEYKNHEQDNEYRMNHHAATYMYNADDFDYLTTFADTFTTTLDNAGITDKFTRLNLLNHLIGGNTYETDSSDAPQLATIYEGKSDCSENTFLYLALLNTSAFDHTRGAYILCDLGSLGLHAVAAIDERDLGTPEMPENIHWITPTDEEKQAGIPDTRYAFVELTSVTKIGTGASLVQEFHGITGITNLVRDQNKKFRTF